MRIAALALVAFLSGCAIAPPAPLPDLAGVPPAFEMTGRLAVRSSERNDIAKLRWTHRPASDLWVIASPLGNEVARIESRSEGAVLSQAGGGSYQADSFADLTERLLGVALDPADLARWLHGGRVGQVASGWTVTIDETRQAGEVEMARRISATRGDSTVRLVVDEYRVLAE